MRRAFIILVLTLIGRNASAMTDTHSQGVTPLPTKVEVVMPHTVTGPQIVELPDAPSATIAAEQLTASKQLDLQHEEQSVVPTIETVSPSRNLIFEHSTGLYRSTERISPLTPCITTLYKVGLARSGNQWPAYGHVFGLGGKRSDLMVADRCTNSFFGEFLFPTLFHQDSRYVRLGAGSSIWRRAEYSVRQLILTRSNAGTEILDRSFIASMIVSDSMEALYHPRQHSALQTTVTRCERAAFNRLQSNLELEFLPDVESHLWRWVGGGFKRIARQVRFARQPESNGSFPEA